MNIINKKIFPILIIAFIIGISTLIFSQNKKEKIQSPIPANTELMKQHLVALTKTPQFRNYKNINQLNDIADYIKNDFEKYSPNISFQGYKVNGEKYKNVIASFGPQNAKRIIIGAHYDVCGDQEGADDNATGVTALLELARMLKDEKLNYRIDLVAYTLEEPPYFRTENMGSYVHAKSLKDEKADVYGMISVEMIGYFSDKENSQDYPLGILSWVYGKKGDYITLVKKMGSGEFVRKFIKNYHETNQLKTEIFSAPKSLTGIDFSDHLNYWNFGYNALMITDTSFYRNKNYHEKGDTLETLDLPKMANVIDGIFLSLLEMN